MIDCASMSGEQARTIITLLAGASCGALAAWFDAETMAPAPDPAPRASATLPAAVPTRAVPARPPEEPPAASSAAPSPSQAPEPAAATPARPKPTAAPSPPRRRAAARFADLPEELKSPHDRPVKTEGQLRVAEVRCGQRLPDECLRAADAYQRGSVVDRSQDQVERNQKVALTLYIKQCNSGDPKACFQLARLYSAGELVQKDKKNAAALRRRAAELCDGKDSAHCRSIVKAVR